MQQARAKLGMCLGHLLIVAPIFFAITIICLRHTSPSNMGLRALQISGLVLLSLMSLGCLMQVACSAIAINTLKNAPPPAPAGGQGLTPDVPPSLPAPGM